EACLCHSHTLTPARPGFNHVYPTSEDLARLVKEPFVYRFEYADGLKATMLLLSGLVRDFTVAARLKGHRELLSTCMFLPYYDVCNFFSPLVNHIETLFLTGRAAYPVERTLLTTGLTAAGVE